MRKRAVLYSRVSTEEQRENGYSLPTQVEGCQEYAARNEFEVLAEVTDDCSGTIPVAERPGGSRIYELLRQRAVDVVVQYTIDRTARDKREYPIEYLIFLRDIQDAGAELHFVDTGPSNGSIVDVFRAWQASEERRKIRERTIRGRIGAAKAGKIVLGGQAPYGLKRENGQLMVNPAEAAVIQRMADLYLGRQGERLSIASMAERFTAEGIPPPRGKKGWYPATIQRMLDSERLVGVFIYKGVRNERPDLAVLDRETWETMQAQREINREQARRNRKYDYLCSCRIKCICGANLYGLTQWDKGGKYFYRCHHRNTGYKHLYSCREPYLHGDEVDRVVWTYIEGLLTDPVNLEAGLDEMVRQREAQLAPMRQRLATVSAELDRAKQKIARLAKAFAGAETDTVAAAYHDELKQAAREKDVLEAERDRLAALVDQSALTPEAKAAILATAETIRQRVESAAFAQKRAVMEVLDVRVQLVRTETGRALQVTCSFDTEGQVFAIEEPSS